MFQQSVAILGENTRLLETHHFTAQGLDPLDRKLRARYFHTSTYNINSGTSMKPYSGICQPHNIYSIHIFIFVATFIYF